MPSARVYSTYRVLSLPLLAKRYSNLTSTISANRMASVANTAHSAKPTPQASPTMAEAHSPAAVVRPLTCFLPVTMIVPAPMKPMPAMTCAPSRPTSVYSPRSRKRYWLVSAVTAAPRQMSICVLNPAGRRLNSRSAPMTPPQTKASSSRSSMAVSVESLIKSKHESISGLLLHFFY